MFGGVGHSAMPPEFFSEQLKNQLISRNRGSARDRGQASRQVHALCVCVKDVLAKLLSGSRAFEASGPDLSKLMHPGRCDIAVRMSNATEHSSGIIAAAAAGRSPPAALPTSSRQSATDGKGMAAANAH